MMKDGEEEVSKVRGRGRTKEAGGRMNENSMILTGWQPVRNKKSNKEAKQRKKIRTKLTYKSSSHTCWLLTESCTTTVAPGEVANTPTGARSACSLYKLRPSIVGRRQRVRGDKARRWKPAFVAKEWNFIPGGLS